MIELLSVIVPVYNTKAYLDECFDSLLSQNYSNIEIIVVDDGSTDGSAEMCDEYANRDSRIRVYHQPNSGVSTARNLGIEKSRGTYVSFMDSDDRILPDIYTEMIKHLEMSEAGLSVSSYTFWYADEDGREEKFTHSLQGVVGRNEAMCEMLLPQSYRSYLFNKIFLGGILRSDPDLRLRTDLKMMEDMDFVARYVVHIDKIVFSPDSYYLYRMRSDSASHVLRISESVKSFGVVIPFIQENYPVSCSEIIRWNYYAALLTYARENKRKDKVLFDECMKKISQERKFFLRHKRYSLLGYLRKIKDELILRYLA